MSSSFDNALSEFVYKRTYAKWDADKGRRENWDETVNRTVDFLFKGKGVGAEVVEEIRKAVLMIGVLPSMRAMMCAGVPMERDNMAGYNCFGGDEKFVTKSGIRTFRQVPANEVVEVLAGDGTWRPATVHRFGIQTLFKVTLSHYTGGKHGNQTHSVRVTSNHRWILQDGSETTALKIGDLLCTPNLAPQDSEMCLDGVRHGFVYGDGTINKADSNPYAQVRLCGKKSRLLKELFGDFKCSYPTSYDGDPMVYLGSDKVHWKKLPNTTDPAYVAGFLRGLYLADGCGTGTSGNLRFSTQDEGLVEWVRENSSLAGYKFLSDQIYTEPTSYGERSNPLHLFLLGTGNSATFRVESIVPDGEEEVYCVVEPHTRSFTLSNGQVTGNCSFAPVDNLRVFGELLYVLMQGTGTGFSVERRFVSKLPTIQKDLGIVLPYVVGDSTEGWADAIYYTIVANHKGIYLDHDYSQVRPKGARLRTKGGRASGPEPLKRVLDFIQMTCRKAQGRRLKPLEAHDIICMEAEIVMVGGFRRASLISFSDVDDQEMAICKDFTQIDVPVYRYMANNSSFYDHKPSGDVFWREWLTLAKSGSGERGFYISSPTRVLQRGGEFRSNPCVTGDTWVQTSEGARQVKDLVGKPFTAVVDGSLHASTEDGFWSTGTKTIVRLKTDKGYLLDLTTNHKVCRVSQVSGKQKFQWVPAGDLKDGDSIRLNNHRGIEIDRDGKHDVGWLLGSLIGDGTFTQGSVSDTADLRFWGPSGESMAKMAFSLIDSTGIHRRSDMKPNYNEVNDFWQVGCVQFANLAKSYGLIPAEKTITPLMERETDSFVCGILSGLFDADGSVMGSHEKGISVRLSQSNLETLRAAQRMLLRVGIVSTLYQNRRVAGYRKMPDGHGGMSDYYCQAQHELSVSNDNLFRFQEVIGFREPSKAFLLDNLLRGYTRRPNAEKFAAKVVSLETTGEQEVFDCTIPSISAFDANGLYVHNCGEILLRFKESNDPWTGEGGGGQLCNLSVAVLRKDDTKESFKRKVELATILGCVQATFTNFPYVRKGWQELCEEDRLIGVDISGHCDNPALSRDTEYLQSLNRVVLETADAYAKLLGINPPAAASTGKPAGNSSQLGNFSSGFHTRYSHYYIRRVRIDGKDPLFQLIRDQGVPVHKETGQEHLPDEEVSVWVAEFPVAAPEGSLTRHDERALDQCNRYLEVMRSWCSERGHNQSATIYVRDDEWIPVGEWLWEHWDEVTGLSFLPFAKEDIKYRLTPYEEITKEQYDDMVSKFPTIDFSLLPVYEVEDMGEQTQTLACVSGACEI